MKWIDDRTALMTDTSILHFEKDGTVEGFMSDKWKRKAKKFSYKGHIFKMPSKQMAIQVFEEMEKLLEQDHGKYNKRGAYRRTGQAL